MRNSKGGEVYFQSPSRRVRFHSIEPVINSIRKVREMRKITNKLNMEQIDFNQNPFLVIWEVTQACDLACVHCRASAEPFRHPLE